VLFLALCGWIALGIKVCPRSLLILKLNLVNRHGGAIISANPGKVVIGTRDKRVDRPKDMALVGKHSRGEVQKALQEFLTFPQYCKRFELTN
jgi:hypothetical protein